MRRTGVLSDKHGEMFCSLGRPVPLNRPDLLIAPAASTSGMYTPTPLQPYRRSRPDVAKYMGEALDPILGTHLNELYRDRLRKPPTPPPQPDAPEAPYAVPFDAAGRQRVVPNQVPPENLQGQPPGSLFNLGDVGSSRGFQTPARHDAGLMSENGSMSYDSRADTPTPLNYGFSPMFEEEDEAEEDGLFVNSLRLVNEAVANRGRGPTTRSQTAGAGNQVSPEQELINRGGGGNRTIRQRTIEQNLEFSGGAGSRSGMQQRSSIEH